MLVLAYVFWHWPAAGTDTAVYEQALMAFHEVLAAAAPEGFGGSVVARVERAPFGPVPDGDAPGAGGSPGAGGAAPVYEDWYLLSGSAGLDPLDAAAVGGRCAAAHATVAAMAGGGTAGLYRLVAGDLPMGAATAAHWLDVPSGEPRGGVVDELTAAASGDRRALWMRRMTLGPAPELCLLDGGGATAPVLASTPGARRAPAQRRRTVWAGGVRPPG